MINVSMNYQLQKDQSLALTWFSLKRQNIGKGKGKGEKQFTKSVIPSSTLLHLPSDPLEINRQRLTFLYIYGAVLVSLKAFLSGLAPATI